MKTEPNDLAYPLAAFDKEGTLTTPDGWNGLTKREYFAAMAMQGFLAGGNAVNFTDAVACADHLINQLNAE